MASEKAVKGGREELNGWRMERGKTKRGRESMEGEITEGFWMKVVEAGLRIVVRKWETEPGTH